MSEESNQELGILREVYTDHTNCKLLKLIGFNLPSLYRYDESGQIFYTNYPVNNSSLEDNECSVVTQDLAIRYLNNVHKLFISVDKYIAYKESSYLYAFTIVDADCKPFSRMTGFKSLEEACNLAINRALNYLTQ